MNIADISTSSISQFPKLCREIAENTASAEVRQLAEIAMRLSEKVEQLETRISCPRPMDLVFVRHGYSEANHAKALFRKGQISEEMLARINSTPDNHFRLTDIGIRQAEAAGLWIKQNINFKFDVCYVSDFRRAQETAAILGTKMGLDVPWRINVFLGERNWGDYLSLDLKQIEAEEKKRISNPRHWRPPVLGGQSLREHQSTLRLGLMSLFSSHHSEAVLSTGHGEQIIGSMDIIEKLPEKLISKLLEQGVPNAGIVHYSRRCPVSGKIDKNFRWRRLVDPTYSDRFKNSWNGSWTRISRPTLTNEELLKLASEQPQFFVFNGDNLS